MKEESAEWNVNATPPWHPHGNCRNAKDLGRAGYSSSRFLGQCKKKQLFVPLPLELGQFY